LGKQKGEERATGGTKGWFQAPFRREPKRDWEKRADVLLKTQPKRIAQRKKRFKEGLYHFHGYKREEERKRGEERRQKTLKVNVHIANYNSERHLPVARQKLRTAFEAEKLTEGEKLWNLPTTEKHRASRSCGGEEGGNRQEYPRERVWRTAGSDPFFRVDIEVRHN